MTNQVKKKKFLKEFLKISADNGWNIASFDETRKKLKYNSNITNNLFPNKLDDLILFYNYLTNEKLSKLYKKKRFNKSSIRVCVLNALKIRFEILNINKISIKKSMIFLANPSKQILSSKLIYKTVDYIWKLIGDKSADYNFYTKRAILASIYSLAIAIWVSENSKDLNKTFNFLNKSIMNMNVVTDVKKKIKETIKQFL